MQNFDEHVPESEGDVIHQDQKLQQSGKGLVEPNSIGMYIRSVMAFPTLEPEEEMTFSSQFQNARTDIATIFLKLPDAYREKVLGQDHDGPSLGANWPLKDMEVCYERMIALPPNKGQRDISALLVEARRLKKCIDYCRETMILSNLRYVIYNAKQVHSSKVSFLDLVQEGTIGLMEAIERHEPIRGFRLVTFAHWWIKKAIFEALSKQSSTIRLPTHVRRKIRRLLATSTELTKSLGRTPTLQEIAHEARIPVPKASEYLQIARTPRPLENTLDSDDSPDLLLFLTDPDSPDPQQRAVNEDIKEKIGAAMSHLSPRKELIVRLHYGIGGARAHTLQEIGKILNLTRERVRQLEKLAMASLSLYFRTAHKEPCRPIRG